MIARQPMVGRSLLAGLCLAGLTAWSGPVLAQPAGSPPAGPSRDARLQTTMVVHIDSPEPVRFEALDADGEWVVRCTSPCDRAVPVSDTYRVTGDGMRDSHAFGLDAGNKVSLAVEPTSSSGHTGAILVTVLGAVALAPAVGVTVLIIGGEIAGAIFICPLVAAFETVKSQQGPIYGQCLGDIATTLGQAYALPYVYIPAIAGAVALTSGIAWLVNTPPTPVTVSVPARPASPGAALPSPLPPAALEATSLRLPSPLTYPVVSVRF